MKQHSEIKVWVNIILSSIEYNTSHTYTTFLNITTNADDCLDACLRFVFTMTPMLMSYTHQHQHHHHQQQQQQRRLNTNVPTDSVTLTKLPQLVTSLYHYCSFFALAFGFVVFFSGTGIWKKKPTKTLLLF